MIGYQVLNEHTLHIGSKFERNLQKKNDKRTSTPERFELSHALHTALAGPRLNHSAKVPICV